MDDDKSYTITLDPSYSYGDASSVTVGSMDTDFNINSGTFTIDTSSVSDMDWKYDSNITVPEDSDIKIGDRSLKTFMDTVEKRLSILQPDPKKLKKFEALQKAYEHYKHLERLCEIDDEDEDEDENPNW
jgi:hypothetical protein